MKILKQVRDSLRMPVTGLAMAGFVTATLLSACGTPENGGNSSNNNNSSVPTSSSSESSSVSSASSSSGHNEQAHTFQDHCIVGFEPHETDGSLPDTYAEYTENGQTDTTVRPEIIQWMEDHSWQEAHFLWHSARRCVGGGGFGGFGGAGGAGGPFGGSNSRVDPCSFTDMLPEENECEGPQDGYEFMVMHRHMIETLRQLWPSMQDHFEGWETFPDREDYPEVVRSYYREWSDQVRSAAALADNIKNMSREEVLAEWPTEGHFGQWLQCGSLQGGLGLNGLHGALHFNGYPSNNQAHSIANQRRNLDAYLFWKLHGWMDSVWEDYREKVGADEQLLEAEMIKQCQEHHFWAEQLDPELTELH